MKIISIIFMITIFIGLGTYYFVTIEDNSTSEENSEVLHSDRKQVIEENNYLTSPKELQNKPKAEVDEKMEKWDKEFDRIEEDWEKKVEVLLINELGLETKKFVEYKKIKEGFERDKIRAFEAFHEKLEEKYGPDYTYNPTEEELMFDKLLTKKYENTILELLGEEGFKRYLLLKDSFNQDLLDSQKESEGTIEMEL